MLESPKTKTLAHGVDWENLIYVRWNRIENCAHDEEGDMQSTKFKRRPQIFVELSFQELCDSKLSGLHAFDVLNLNWLKIER